MPPVPSRAERGLRTNLIWPPPGLKNVFECERLQRLRSSAMVAANKYQTAGAYTAGIHGFTVWGLDIQDQGVGKGPSERCGGRLCPRTPLLGHFLPVCFHMASPLCLSLSQFPLFIRTLDILD